eukprot:TRINITY_DN29012_c0_g1_i1.p1 TRINITY_DN29012_c0_g1~~TRINITY_DN29012_c0_g1_i1.p1  ORF type:complete len:228 (-),score=-18.55 TRINITY_DN29012_c0_g1_i1:196-804(-)
MRCYKIEIFFITYFLQKIQILFIIYFIQERPFILCIIQFVKLTLLIFSTNFKIFSTLLFRIFNFQVLFLNLPYIFVLLVMIYLFVFFSGKWVGNSQCIFIMILYVGLIILIYKLVNFQPIALMMFSFIFLFYMQIFKQNDQINQSVFANNNNNGVLLFNLYLTLIQQGHRFIVCFVAVVCKNKIFQIYQIDLSNFFFEILYV